MLRVTIIGRPNVGKSTLFNRIISQKKAVVSDTPGTTRDINVGRTNWNGKEFYLVDTGGLLLKFENEIEKKVKDIISQEINKSHLVLFVVDAQSGLNSYDEILADLIRRESKTDIILIVNKVDNYQKVDYYNEFYSLGFKNIVYVSALHGINTGDLLDSIVEKIQNIEFKVESKNEVDDIINFCIVGKPNVGKSSIINKIINSDVRIVSDIPGTTVDISNIPIKYNNKIYNLIDTAGLRRKSKIKKGIEKYSVTSSIKAVKNSEITALIIDVQEGLSMQDKRILNYVVEQGKGIVIIINKWDLIDKTTYTFDIIKKEIYRSYSEISYVPVLSVSALTGQRISKILNEVEQVYKYYNQKIKTSILNKFLIKISSEKIFYRHGKTFRMYYCTQNSVAPVEFTIFVNNTDIINKSIERFVQNKFRNEFKFTGVPIKINFRQRNTKHF